MSIALADYYGSYLHLKEDSFIDSVQYLWMRIKFTLTGFLLLFLSLYLSIEV